MPIIQYDPKYVLLTFRNSIPLFHTESKHLIQVWQSKLVIKLSIAKADSYGNLLTGTLNHGIWILPQADQEPFNFSAYFNLTWDQKNLIFDMMVDSKQGYRQRLMGMGLP